MVKSGSNERTEEEQAHARALELLNEARIDYVVGGAFAVRAYTGIWRDTKDLDIFLMKKDVERTLTALNEAGYRVELTDPIWLAKAFHGEFFVDLIFGSYNQAVPIDETWFRHGRPVSILGVSARVAAPEEMIWSKIYVQDRERYDGADIAHLLRATGDSLDWKRLFDRLGSHWALILSQLMLYRFIYPGDREKVPRWVVETLLERASEEEQTPSKVVKRLCRGPLLSRCSYAIDVEGWGYLDARQIESKAPGEPA